MSGWDLFQIATTLSRSGAHDQKDSVTFCAAEADDEADAGEAVDVADGVTVASDRELVRLILQNLLLNTTKHAKRNGGMVHVTAEQRGGGALLIVADQGPGIPKAQVDFDDKPI